MALKILLQNENEYIVRTVDEARIREAELQADIHEKELEAKEKKCEVSQGLFKKRVFIYLVLACIGYAGGFGFMSSNNGLAAVFLYPGMIGMICFFYGTIIH